MRGWHARKLLRWPQEVDCSVDQDTRPVRRFYLDVFQALFLFYSTFDTAVLKSMSPAQNDEVTCVRVIVVTILEACGLTSIHANRYLFRLCRVHTSSSIIPIHANAQAFWAS